MEKTTLDNIRLILIFSQGAKSAMGYEEAFCLFGQFLFRMRYGVIPKNDEEKELADAEMERWLFYTWGEVYKVLPEELLQEITDYRRFCLGFGKKETFKKLQAFYEEEKDGV